MTHSSFFSHFLSFSQSVLQVLPLFCVSFFLFNGFLWQEGKIYAQTGFSSPVNSGSAETDSLYREMLSSVEAANSISAEVRQQIRLFGQDYTTSGTYNELKSTELRGKRTVRFRLEIQVQPPADVREIISKNSLTVVCDNSNNYIYRNFSVEGENCLEKIVIKRLIETIEKQVRNDVLTEVGSMFGLGGLAGMLRDMRNRYDFNVKPMQTQIQEKNSTMAVWKIRGRIKQKIITALTTDVTGKKQSIPRHMPTTIDIYIGFNDRFPYRFEYFWTADGTEATGEPFAYLLFYNLILHDRNISETIFDYRPPGNILPLDVTDQMINQMLR